MAEPFSTEEELMELLEYAEAKEDSGVVIKLRAEIKQLTGKDPETEIEQRRRNNRRE